MPLFLRMTPYVLIDNGSRPHSLAGRMVFALDKVATQQADKVILDTQTHAQYFQHTFGVPTDKLETLYLGCDEKVFVPLNMAPTIPFTVFTYSTYLPLHGMNVIVDAAEYCRDYGIQFRLVGNEGLTYQRVRQRAEQKKLHNIEFVPSLPFAQLPSEIAKASICLGGHFGRTEKGGSGNRGKNLSIYGHGETSHCRG